LKTFKLTETLNLPVVSLDSGRSLGECQGYIFDSSKQAVALQVSQKGIFKKFKTIPIADIASVGRDAVVVTSEKNLVEPRKVPEIARAIEEKLPILNAMVLTEKGENFGNVSEVVIETGSGKISSILISQGMIKDITRGPTKIPGENIKMIGPDRIIISRPVEKKTEKKPAKPGPIFQGFEKAVITAGRLGGQAKRKLTKKGK